MSDSAPGALAAGDAAQRVLALAEELGLRAQLPAACEAEAQDWVSSPGIDEASLVDRTDLPFVTIDEVQSKDLDQALFVEQLDRGWRAWYAIADAAHFVPRGGALFAEALHRGATYYLPGLVVPMLPRALCEDLVSLNPGVDRRALLFCMELGSDGRCTSSRIERARIHSRAKLDYDGVQAWLEGRVELPTELHPSLHALASMGEARLAEAESRDVVQVYRAELEMTVAGAPLRFHARLDPRNDLQRYNEQLSLLANIEGARLLARHASAPHVQAIFRTHEPPAPERLAVLRREISSLVGGLSGEWRWRRDESLACYLRRLPAQPLRRAISRQALRSGGRSGFQTSPGRHHGVGADAYARFTAPMREMVGVFVHKETWEALAGRGDADLRLQEQVMEGALRSKQLQRKIDSSCERLVLDQLFESGGSWPATVMGLSSSKLHLQLDDPPVDAKLYLRDWPGARADGAVLRVEGRAALRVGDSVRVRASGRDEQRDRWRLALF